MQLTHKKSDRRKERMANLLKRQQGIITGLPYATVVLNENNEIDWMNLNCNCLIQVKGMWESKTQQGLQFECSDLQCLPITETPCPFA